MAITVGQAAPDFKLFNTEKKRFLCQITREKI